MRLRLSVNYHLLQKKGDESLERLLEERLRLGYDELEVISVFMTAGFEFSLMRRRVLAFRGRGRFKKITVTRPVLSGWKKTAAFAAFLIEEYKLNLYDDYVFVGHGLPGRRNGAYFALERALRRRGFGNVRVALLKGRSPAGFPAVGQGRKIIVYPLLISCGKHAREDILGDKDSFCTELEARGFAVERNFTSLDKSGRFKREFLGLETDEEL